MAGEGVSDVDSEPPPDDSARRDDPGEEALENQHSLWVRWTDVDATELNTEFDGVPIGSIHLHRFCDVIPDNLLSGSGSRDDSDGDDEPEFKFVRGIVRTGLQFTPSIILLVTLGLVIYGEFSTVDGVTSLLPALPVYLVQYAIGGGLLWLVIIVLANRLNLVDNWDLVRGVVVFGLIGALLTGSVYSVSVVTLTVDSISVVTPAETPPQLSPNIVFVSGYLLLLLLGGLLVYDGMLKTEFMIEHFGDWEHSIVTDQEAYDAWKEDLSDNLDDTIADYLVDLSGDRDGRISELLKMFSAKVKNTVLDIPITHILAVLFVSQFGVIWWVQLGPQGPQELDSNLVLLLNVALDIFLVVVAFRFLILVKYLYALLSDSYVPKDSERNVQVKKILQYEPFHVDRHGGFKDLGRFATRVNLLLVIAGIYTVFRLYVQGFRALPAVQSEFELVLWAGSYVLPIVAYGVAAVAWLYYSFWAMHRKMLLDKQTICMKTQGVRSSGEAMPAVGDPIEEFEEGPDWYYLNTAPEWPINSRWLVSLASANVAPILLPVLNVLYQLR